jgi:NADH-quinone oxidoreductase subunit C
MLPEPLRDYAPAVALEELNPAIIVGGHADRGEPTLYLNPDHLVEACRKLKEQFAFIRLSSVTAVDRYPDEPRFEVVYHLHSLENNTRLRLKCRAGGEAPAVPSVTSVWTGANWYEREVFDLFGVSFRDHPDLRRILMPDDWEGHPLRKDYPTHGYKYSYKD